MQGVSAVPGKQGDALGPYGPRTPTVTPEAVVTESQVTKDPATLEADHQDCQVMCKYSDRHFKNIAECNMHVNRRHKKVMCPQYEKCFVKQEDCDNHVWARP